MENMSNRKPITYTGDAYHNYALFLFDRFHPTIHTILIEGKQSLYIGVQ